MKFFIRFFIFIIVLLIGAYGFAWYKNKQAVDQIFQVYPGNSYDTTYVDINGDSVIKGIQLTLPQTTDTINIDEIRTGTGNPLTTIKVSRAFNSGDMQSLPAHFDFYLNFSGIKFPITLDENSDNAGKSSFLDKVQLAGCGVKKSLSLIDIRKLGISQIASDMNFNVSFNTLDKKINGDIYLKLVDFNTSKLSFIVDNFSFENPFGAGLGTSTLEVSDNGIQRKVNQMCAEQQELSKEQYTERHVSYLKHLFFKEGIYLSPEFYEQYAKYHTDPRSIKIISVPTSAINPMSLAAANPGAIMRKLNVQLYFNDNEINQLYGNKPDVSELPQLDKVVKKVSTLKTIQGLTVQDTPVSDLNKYIGYEAYYNYRGKKYKGKIKSVRGNTATINYQFSSGNRIEQPFAISRITNLKVRREFVPEKPVEEVVKELEAKLETEIDKEQ